MLTAHATLETSIEAMRLGTCDFLLKPYEFEALLRGVKIAIQRRQQKVHQKLAAQLLVSSLGLSAPIMPPPPKQFMLQLHLEGMTVSKDGEIIPLTGSEFKLLTAMLKQPDHAFTFQELAELIYNQKLDLFQARDLLKSHLGRLRQKLGEDYIINVRGVGYKLRS
jgi:DNA-binding response OmpR family regulator